MIETNKNVKNGKKKIWWIIGIFAPILFASLLAWDIHWRVWVTDCVYGQTKDQSVTKESVDVIKSDVKSTKDGLDGFKTEVTNKFEAMRKEIKSDIDKINDKISTGQLEQMKILKDIERKVR